MMRVILFLVGWLDGEWDEKERRFKNGFGEPELLFLALVYIVGMAWWFWATYIDSYYPHTGFYIILR